MLTELLSMDRGLRLQRKDLLNYELFSEELDGIMHRFVNAYLKDNKLGIKEVLSAYNGFIENYLQDVCTFEDIGKYPYERGKEIEIERKYYDIVLLLSVILTRPRHLIMKNLFEYVTSMKGNVLVVGIGPGIEVELMDNANHIGNIDAYDTSISSFLKNRFSNINLNEQEFIGKDDAYQNVFAIELLEHLTNPLAFCEMVYKSLQPGGSFITTTATNMPQQDHLYNFTDSRMFEAELESMNFEIVEAKEVEHQSSFSKINARNNWYILRKAKSL